MLSITFLQSGVCEEYEENNEHEKHLLLFIMLLCRQSKTQSKKTVDTMKLMIKSL